jgi:putative ABC transport system permease protein
MNFGVAFMVGLNALRANRMRTVLTMLGMIIGVAAVIGIAALGTGAQEAIEDRISASGANMLVVRAGNRTIGGVRLGMGASSRLTDGDTAAIRALPGVAYVSSGLRTRAQIVWAGENWNTSIEGTGADMPMIHNWRVEAGSFFTAQNVRDAEKVAVLGSEVRDEIFGPLVNPIGRTVRVGIVPLKVVGVLASRGQSSGGQDQDDTVFVPYTTVQKRLQGQQNIQNITLSAASADSVSDVADSVAVVLRNQHKLISGDADDFTIRTQEEIANIRTASIETFTQLLAGIAAVSLIVGGIGIMNIMLVSVTERTREIGIRLAIGAKGRDVLLQFLVEAIVISLLGGGIGIALGFGMAELATRVWEFPTAVPPNAVVMAFGFSAITGIFFGFYPARKAAALDPIVALRYE